MSQTHDSSLQSSKPDALRDLYHEAVAEDRGPSAQSRAAILEHARQQAAEYARKAKEPELLNKPAANDRLWLRHALGSLAAVGLVGWLMMQHFASWDGSDSGIGAGVGAGPVADSTPMAHTDAGTHAAEEAVPADVAAADAPEHSSAEIAAVPADAVADAGPSTSSSAAAAAVAPAGSANRARPAPSPAPRVPQVAEQASPREDLQPNAQANVQTPAIQAETEEPQSAAKGSSAQAKMRSPAVAEKAIPAETGGSSKAQTQLPLCPPEPQTPQAREEARKKQAQQGASQDVDKVPQCRPRKKPQAHEGAAQDASEKGADSEN